MGLLYKIFGIHPTTFDDFLLERKKRGIEEKVLIDEEKISLSTNSFRSYLAVTVGCSSGDLYVNVIAAKGNLSDTLLWFEAYAAQYKTVNALERAGLLEERTHLSRFLNTS